MKYVPENELLSAYLDGELTADQQAEVERLLARSPAARQLLDELRTLSSKLQSLPQYKLDEDLSQRVLRIAERRMLTQPALPGELPKPAPTPRRAILRRVFNSRALVWSSLAVAIAVMLTVINRGPQDRPAGDGLAKAPPAAEEKDGRAPEIGAAPEAEEQRDRPRVGEVQPVLTVETQGKGLGDVGLARQPTPARPKSLPLPKDMKGQRLEEFALEKVAPAPGAPRTPSKGGVDSGYRYTGKNGNGTTSGSIAADALGGQMGKAGSGMKANAGDTGALAANMSGTGGFPRDSQVGLTTGFLQPARGFAVVCCDISPKAFRGQTFDRLLAVNGIALEGTEAEEADAGGTHTFTDVDRGLQQDRGREKKQKLALADTRSTYQPQTGELDLVCVQATHEQIEATLAALKKQTGEVLSISVKPALGVEAQQEWGRQYGRGLQERARRGGKIQPGPADDSPHALTRSSPEMAEKRQGAEGMGTPTPGYAWRFQVSGPEQHSRLNSQISAFGLAQFGAAGQQPGPATPPPLVPGGAQPPAEKPAGAPFAQHAAEAAAPAEHPEESPPPARQPADSPTQSREPAKSPAPGERPEKSLGSGQRLDESSNLLFGGRAVQRLALRDRIVKAEEDAARQEPGSATRKAPPGLPAGSGREGERSPKEAGNKPADRDDAKGEFKTRQAQEPPRPQPKPEQPQRPATTYRVLFVLRMVRPDILDRPGTAASMIEPAEPPAARIESAK